VQGRPRRLDRRRDEASLEGDVAQTEPAPDHRDVRAAVRTLDESERLLVLLRYWADLTQPEVARLTKLPEGTVKVRLHRARQRLRAALEAA
jgi:RNA polymerase sigma-70 factor (ECF subfamily)